MLSLPAPSELSYDALAALSPAPHSYEPTSLYPQLQPCFYRYCAIVLDFPGSDCSTAYRPSLSAFLFDYVWISFYYTIPSISLFTASTSALIALFERAIPEPSFFVITGFLFFCGATIPMLVYGTHAYVFLAQLLSSFPLRLFSFSIRLVGCITCPNAAYNYSHNIFDY